MKGILLLLCFGSLVISVHLDEDDGFGLDETINAQPRLVSSEWSQCSVSCGNGVESRSVECRVSHPIAGNLRLPLYECRNLPSPPLFRPCSMHNCALKEEESVVREQFHWKHSDWSACSVSCLGGKQRALLQCIQLSNGRPVEWSNCDGRRRPPERTRSCNARPCPPEWIVSDWSSCSNLCGSMRFRSIVCQSRASLSGGAIGKITHNDTQCTGVKPVESELCPDTECNGWKVSAWSQCSVSCGEGRERRTVECTNTSSCTLPPPSDTRKCVRQSCGHYENEEDKEGKGKKLTLDLGGIATVYEGTSIKVKCPKKKDDKRTIYWIKNGHKLTNNGNTKISSNGNLRISHARVEDEGIYECMTRAGSKGNVTIRFKVREKEMRYNERVKGEKKLRKTAAKIKTGQWGKCHQSNCQLRGIQERSLECYVMDGNSHRPVSLSICQTLNITIPPTSRPCSRIHCSKWNATGWSPCNTSKCIRKWTSEQSRNIECISSTGRKVDDTECDPSSKPSLTAICANPSCIPEWRSSHWSGCSSTCGTGGVQLRILNCLWSNTGKPAGDACDGLNQPRTTRACSHTAPLPQCSPRRQMESPPQCEDLSRFCPIINLFHSCESEQVRQRCCATCNQVDMTKLL